MSNENLVVNDLRQLLANTYTLYTKTQNFHWNVTGELFFMLHSAFEEQYEELADAVDVLAERIRALNEFAPATFKLFQELSTVTSSDKIPSAIDMISELRDGHELIIGELDLMIKRAEEAEDQSTMDLMIERQTHHQKMAWMLRSCLKNKS